MLADAFNKEVGALQGGAVKLREGSLTALVV